MDPRVLTPNYSVSPQISPDDMQVLASLGVTTVICNRPDGENPAELQSDVMKAKAEAAGLTFVFNPFTMNTLNPEIMAAQAAVIADDSSKTLAYCASGTRSTVIWMLTQAGKLPTDDMMNAAEAAGYQLEGLRPQIEQLAQNG